MKFGIDSGIPYGNVCDVTLTPDGDTLEVAFAPDPHGGPETLWFCFRVHRSQGPGPDVSQLRLRLKHSYNMLGGQGPETMRPVVRYEEGPWRRLPQGELLTYADGRVDVHWSVAVPNQSLDVAYCYPYGRDDLTTLLAETHGYWRLDTIGVSQAARPLVRLSNDYGEEDSTRPGLYLVARQHAGETPSSWVLDGFLRALADLGDDAPLTWGVPLANIDGIESGDYGKDNFPYDLNRAWGRPPMRHEVSVFQRDMARWRHRCHPILGIDFHAPVACETCGVYVYLPDPDTDRGVHDIMRRWAAWTLEELGSTYAADPFDRVARYPSRWETPRFRDYGWLQLGLPCITFETPYAMAGEKVLTQEDYREIGRRLVAGTMRGIEAILE